MRSDKSPYGFFMGRPRVLTPGVIVAVAVLSVLYAILLPTEVAAQEGGIPASVFDNFFLKFQWDDGIFGRMMKPFKDGQVGWGEAAVSAAGPIYLALASLELAISGYGYAMKSEAPDVIMRELTKKMLLLGAGGALMQYYSQLVWPFARGLAGAGGYITTGNPNPADPGDVFGRGVKLAFKIMFGIFRPDIAVTTTSPVNRWWIPDKIEEGADMALGTLTALRKILMYLQTGPLFILAVIMVALCALTVFGAFLTITLQLVRATVETAIMLGVGVFLLGFSGSRITAGITEGYLSYVIETGMRFFMLNAIVGVGIKMTDHWQARVASAFYDAPDQVVSLWWFMPNFSVLMEIMLGSLIFVYLAWTIPNKFAAVATKNLSFGLQQAIAS